MGHRDPRGRDGADQDGRRRRRHGGDQTRRELSRNRGASLMADRRRVVITGIGPVTPVGTGVDDFWAGMTSGSNGVRTITQFPTDDLPVTVAGEVPDFE